MKLSISEARKSLPELVRRVRKDAGAKVEITVHDEVVAELRGTLPDRSGSQETRRSDAEITKTAGSQNKHIRTRQRPSLCFGAKNR